MLLFFQGLDGQGVPAKGSELSEQTILKKEDQKIVLKKDNQERENENIKKELKTQLVSFIPHICHESHENSRVNFFWPV